MKRMQYAVFAKNAQGKRTWCRFSNKKDALAAAKTVNGEVRTMGYNPGPDYWDSPTFYVCSERIYPK